jgi:hypothetical protein
MKTPKKIGTYIWVVPAQNIETLQGTIFIHGIVAFGYNYNDDDSGDGYAQGGMNDKGLCVDGNALPLLSLNPHPERESPFTYPIEQILMECNTINDVIEWFNSHNLGTQWSNQLHFADASGDAAVVSVGDDGEFTFTRISSSKYLVSTNFNLANSDVGQYPCQQYDTATNMLEAITSEQELTVDSVRNVLNAIREEGQYGTKYSNIFDPVNREIYLYHNHDFGKVVKLNLDDEVAQVIPGTEGVIVGDMFFLREIKIADLFQPSPVSSTISCSVSASEMTEDEAIIVSGAINPALEDKTVTLIYMKPDSSTVTRTVTTDSEGSYSDSYIPNVDGSWSVRASWDGDSTHEGSSSSSQSFTVKKSGCLIATATYGSELSPQVQFLRGFRDNTVLSSFDGSNFMMVFNGFYYSFSPKVAAVIDINSALRDVMKGLLYPLIGILQVSSAVVSVFYVIPEFGVIVAGLIASSLIGVIYFLPIALIFSYFKKFKVSEKIFHWMGLIWLGNVLFLVIAEVVKIQLMMMVSTGVLVLVTIITATLTTLRIVSKRLIP